MRGFLIEEYGAPTSHRIHDLPDLSPGVNEVLIENHAIGLNFPCLLYTSPSPRDGLLSRMPSSA